MVPAHTQNNIDAKVPVPDDATMVQCNNRHVIFYFAVLNADINPWIDGC
jgi:hypothetical protein